MIITVVLLTLTLTGIFLTRGEKASYNVILITINTLRADHVSTYGYARKTTPYLDEFAKENLVFEKAITQSPVTWTAHASLFTAEYPDVHGLLAPEPFGKLDPSSLTLAEILKTSYYKTAAFVGKEGGVRSNFGLAQGFDVYQGETNGSFSINLPKAIEWIKKNKDSKFFVFVHGNDVHDPYLSPEPFVHAFDPDYTGVLDHKRFFHQAPRSNVNFAYAIKKTNDRGFFIEKEGEKIPLTKSDIDHVIAHYDGGILYVDSLIQQFLEKLKEFDVYDNSIIIILGDHGESLGDSLVRPLVHDERVFGHGILYEELIHVPFIIRYPGPTPKRISNQVELVDVLPTLLDALDIPLSKEIKKRAQGKSLVPLIKGGGDRSFKKYTYGDASNTGSYNNFVRTTKWKLISSNTGFELYNLEEDPKETSNVLEAFPTVAAELEQKLKEWQLNNLKKKSELLGSTTYE